MNEPIQGQSPAEAPRRSAGVVAFILSGLASLKFALGVVLLIALACVAGTLIPQGAQQVAGYLAAHPGTGPHRVMYVLDALGLTRVFYSWWFVALLCVLAASLLVCTARRYAVIGRTTGAVRLRVIGSFITHVGLLLVLVGGAMRVVWGQQGMIQFHEGETVSDVAGSAGPFPLPFSIRLAKFEVEFYKDPVPTSESSTDKLLVQWPERKLEVAFPVKLKVAYPVAPPDSPAGAEPAFTVTMLRYLPDFAIGEGGGEAQSRSDEPINPALQVSVTGGGTTNTQWVFARFPDFGSHGGADGAAPLPLKFRFEVVQSEAAMGRAQSPIKAFRSTVDVLEGGAVVHTSTVAVNSPFSYRGYTFYQSSYDPQDLAWSALHVVQDPGVPVVYSGFVLMMVGLTVVFCVGPWLDSQRRTKGESS
ncbi:MAG: cytochrome c biogenesis protein ResB [bacterium]